MSKTGAAERARSKAWQEQVQEFVRQGRVLEQVKCRSVLLVMADKLGLKQISDIHRDNPASGLDDVAEAITSAVLREREKMNGELTAVVTAKNNAESLLHQVATWIEEISGESCTPSHGNLRWGFNKLCNRIAVLDGIEKDHQWPMLARDLNAAFGDDIINPIPMPPLGWSEGGAAAFRVLLTELQYLRLRESQRWSVRIGRWWGRAKNFWRSNHA